jgi:hypothetical protein
MLLALGIFNNDELVPCPLVFLLFRVWGSLNE